MVPGGVAAGVRAEEEEATGVFSMTDF